MSMDKAVWLGDTLITVELILNMLYPDLDGKHLMLA